MDDFGVRFALYWPALLDGALTTLWLCLAGMLLGFVLGVLIYLLGSSRSRGCVAFAGVYVSFFRGTPMLAQLLLLFYLPACRAGHGRAGAGRRRSGIGPEYWGLPIANPA